MNLFSQKWPFGDLPQHGFGLIMADPPWAYENWSKAGEHKNASAKYDCQSLLWIKQLPVAELADDDCILWLWAINPLLPEAIEVMAEWGFKFKTAGTWVKRTVHGKDAFGTGYLLRSSNEPFLIGTRGQPVTSKSVRSTVASGKAHDTDPLANIGFTIEAIAREHSRKPDEAFTAAEKLMPNAHRLELFSRQERENWSVWGNQTDKFKGVA
jgi:N6-adenosine-specific RNA methylase IME4